MATNKNALIRYKVLDNCFRNTGRRYFIDDLISECNKVLTEIDLSFNGISRRQIFDDISFMESAEGWSIELMKYRDGKKVFYRYLDPAFSINKANPRPRFPTPQIVILFSIILQLFIYFYILLL